MLTKFRLKYSGLLSAGLLLASTCGLATAATLTIVDDADTETVTLGSTDFVTLQTYGSGNMRLTLSGLAVTVSDGSGSSGGSTDGGSTGGGSTDGGSTDGGSTDGGSTGGGSTDGGSTGGGSTDGGSTGGGSTGGGSTNSDEYCSGVDADLAECDPDVNYDPWIGSTGEVPYWIRNKRTKVIPFTTATPAESQYGYLQITTFEALRDKYSEDIFHIWFSETPNGPPLDGVKCEYYAQQAKLNLYWTQQDKYADQVCFLGTTARTFYVNAETRCSPRHYKGACRNENEERNPDYDSEDPSSDEYLPAALHKSKQSYNFDVSRRTQ